MTAGELFDAVTRQVLRENVWLSLRSDRDGDVDLTIYEGEGASRWSLVHAFSEERLAAIQMSPHDAAQAIVSQFRSRAREVLPF